MKIYKNISVFVMYLYNKIKKRIPLKIKIFIKQKTITLKLLLLKKFKILTTFLKQPKVPKNLTYERVIYNFEEWVKFTQKKYGIRDFIEPDFEPSKLDTSKNYCIQQVKEEIYELVRIILEHNLTDTILEIGLGYHGGTHVLWGQIFNKVITIEIDSESLLRFIKNVPLTHKDIFILGNSNDIRTLKKVRKIAKQIDILFIDGGHRYENVKNDYLMYKNLVKKGGIIVFHDSACNMPEIGFDVFKFVKELEEGLIDGEKHILYHIIYSKAVGISYEIVK